MGAVEELASRTGNTHHSHYCHKESRWRRTSRKEKGCDSLRTRGLSQAHLPFFTSPRRALPRPPTLGQLLFGRRGFRSLTCAAFPAARKQIGFRHLNCFFKQLAPPIHWYQAGPCRGWVQPWCGRGVQKAGQQTMLGVPNCCPAGPGGEALGGVARQPG